MKFIFDFDDVLFNNTAQFKEHMFRIIAEAGVLEAEAREYYLKVREKEFSLKDFIQTLFKEHNLRYSVDEIYKKIMRECPKFINTALIKEVEKLGKDSCYIITNGEQEFNNEKLKYSGIGKLFYESHIHIVPGSKKEIIYNICDKNKNEKIIFIDDKIKFLADIDMSKCPNLKTILYGEHGLEKLTAVF